MKLSQLLAGIVPLSCDIEVHGLEEDSRQVNAGDVFVALKGECQDGLKYAQQAINNGAIAVLYDSVDADSQLLTNTNLNLFVAITNLNSIFPKIAARYYAYPSQTLNIIGITGTNGKTSCSQFLAQCFDNAGIIGTLGWGEWGCLQATINTTPSVLLLQSMLAQFQKQQKQNVFMEVSSHGLEQGRIEGIDFKGAVFTQLSRDHLDYHGSMEAYFQSKLRLFQRPELEFAVINRDDEYGQRIIASLAKDVCLWTYSRQTQNMAKKRWVSASDVRHLKSGLEFKLHFENQTEMVSCALYGDFNVENLLAVVTTLLALGIDFNEVVKRVASIQAVTGRMQQFGGDKQPLVFVDYAHTPDALAKTLSAIKQHGQQVLTVVFGCGGDRDTGKRAQMGQIACQYADKVIVTDDNPRTEAPEKIIADILTGCAENKVSVISDRAKAIKIAIESATVAECILIAGKGHEDYQEINGIKHHFDDREQAVQALACRLG